MDIRIPPQKLTGSLSAIPSKSHCHRLLLAAALGDIPTVITLTEICEDITCTATALQTLGMGWKPLGNNRYQIIPLKKLPSGITLDCGSSGTTLRFLLPIVAALGGKDITFKGSEQLKKRPVKELLKVLTDHGIRIQGESLPFTLTGTLKGGDFALPGNVSSQYISGLLFALPLLQEDSTITLTTPLESASYVDLTLAVSEQFRIKIYRKPYGFYCKGNQSYHNPMNLIPAGDWSNAAFWLTAGVISQAVSVEGLDFRSRQGDKAIMDIIRKAGGEVIVTHDTVTATPSPLTAFSVDVAQIPDLTPILAVLGCTAKGATEIYGGHRLRLKESDRLHTVAKNLAILGAEIKETADGLMIHGGNPLKGGTVTAAGDHRLAMSLTIASLLCTEPVILKHAETVAKSYPSFYCDFQKLGGRYDVL